MNKTYIHISILLVLNFLLTLNSCSKEPDPLTPHNDNDSTSVQLNVTKNHIAADNFTYAEITAISKSRPNAKDIIEFKADKGTFSNGNSTISLSTSYDDTLRAYLKYNKSDAVRVTASFYNKYSKSVFVNFITAYPTEINVSPDTNSLLPSFNSKCLINTKLIRQPGNASEGLYLSYYDSVASGGGSIGSFYNHTYSDSQGNSTVEYSLQDTSYHGFVYIKSFIDTGGGLVSGMNKIYIH